MRHCALAKLPGRGGLAGEILSHDFVEAALMGRRGYEVWLVPDLGGSWEQSPSNLLDELQRDRRWCQGNLQNLRLVAEPGWRPAHRMMFSVGALSYLVAPLWLLFMVLGLGGGSLLGRDLSLWLLTLALLILPRVMGVVVIAARGEAAAFGGTVRLSIGAVIELLMSTIQAPIRMLAHCLFVLGALTGLKLEWKSPPRGGEAVSWRDASRRMGSLTMLPLAASLGLLRMQAAFVAMVPMLLPLSLAVPFTVITGHPRAGRAVARLGLLRTPEEWKPTRELVRASESHSFIDLVPVPAVQAPVLAWARPRRALRLASASLMVGVGRAGDDGAAIGHRTGAVAYVARRVRHGVGVARRAGDGGLLDRADAAADRRSAGAQAARGRAREARPHDRRRAAPACARQRCACWRRSRRRFRAHPRNGGRAGPLTFAGFSRSRIPVFAGWTSAPAARRSGHEDTMATLA